MHKHNGNYHAEAMLNRIKAAVGIFHYHAAFVHACLYDLEIIEYQAKNQLQVAENEEEQSRQPVAFFEHLFAEHAHKALKRNYCGKYQYSITQYAVRI
ncbi:MAG: hypothetical protein K0Q79_317 [Flavipsychrobacter sp.]|jgi:hypothetical protein|nr:hypothetical protein [Flavipsychrobacter sp.]